jgi:hypothetical protein
MWRGVSKTSRERITSKWLFPSPGVRSLSAAFKSSENRFTFRSALGFGNSTCSRFRLNTALPSVIPLTRAWGMPSAKPWDQYMIMYGLAEYIFWQNPCKGTSGFWRGKGVYNGTRVLQSHQKAWSSFNWPLLFRLVFRFWAAIYNITQCSRSGRVMKYLMVTHQLSNHPRAIQLNCNRTKKKCQE